MRFQTGSHIARDTTATEYTATFDDSEDTANLAQNLLNIILAPSLGTYDGLEYNALTLVNIADLIVGTHAQSGSNVLGFDVVSSIISGPSTIQAPGAPEAVAFDLKSFYFACIVLTFVPLISPAIPCTLEVFGYDSDDNVVASASKKFKAGILNVKTNTVQLTTPMGKFILPANFSTQLDSVEFELTPSIPILSAGLIDTIEQVLYLEKS